MRGRMDKNGCSEKRSRQKEALPARLKKDVENLRTYALCTGTRRVLSAPSSSAPHRGIALLRLFRGGRERAREPWQRERQMRRSTGYFSSMYRVSSAAFDFAASEIFCMQSRDETMSSRLPVSPTTGR